MNFEFKSEGGWRTLTIRPDTHIHHVLEIEIEDGGDYASSVELPMDEIERLVSDIQNWQPYKDHIQAKQDDRLEKFKKEFSEHLDSDEGKAYFAKINEEAKKINDSINYIFQHDEDWSHFAIFEREGRLEVSAHDEDNGSVVINRRTLEELYTKIGEYLKK